MDPAKKLATRSQQSSLLAVYVVVYTNSTDVDRKWRGRKREERRGEDGEVKLE